ncbi:MAG: Na+/H+ antiporter subunit E [Ideonella sp.]|nr:Na+/H+ antiporter subunit E [Ideonella sp.]MCC7459412.1 Na+/H+ antiporter subunit E [Nitrospira sp.]
MRRLLPSPWLSLGLFGGWLLLVDRINAAQLLLGLAVALVVPPLAAPLRPASGPLRRWRTLARLVLRVGGDVVRSAIAVALGVLRAHRRAPRGAFVHVPLELRDLHGLAALAMITAVVPGTVWCELASDRSVLLLHVFDVHHEAAFVAQYKARYERPLQEIFG